MEEINFVSLVCILVIGSIWDLTKKKIPNALILLGLILGLVLSFVEQSWMGLVYSLLGIFLTFIFFIFTWGVLGAGDIKLLMVIGSFGGFGVALNIGFYSIIIGGVVFLFLIPLKELVQMLRSFLFLLYYKIPVILRQNQKHVAFAPIILFSFLIFK